MSDAESEDDLNLPSAAECDQRCKMFAEITGTDTALAMFYLQDREWNLDRSVNAFFEDKGSSGPSTKDAKSATAISISSSSDTDDEASGPNPSKRQKQKEIESTIPNSKTALIDDEPHRIRLLSWNIDGLDKGSAVPRTKVVCEIINRENPHVVFLQEVTPATIPIIESHCPTYQVIPGGELEYFTAILLKVGHVQYEGVTVIDFTNSVMLRNLLCVKCKVKDIPFEVMTSHLESTKDYKEERIAQLRQAIEHLAKADKNRTVIFGGDLNLRDNEVAKLPKDVADIWVDTGSRPECRYTWDMTRNTNLQFQGKFKPRLRFDRLYIRHASKPTVKAVYFELTGLEKIQSCGKFPSDHWGLMTHYNVLSRLDK